MSAPDAAETDTVSDSYIAVAGSLTFSRLGACHHHNYRSSMGTNGIYAALGLSCSAVATMFGVERTPQLEPYIQHTEDMVKRAKACVAENGLHELPYLCRRLLCIDDLFREFEVPISEISKDAEFLCVRSKCNFPLASGPRREDD